MTERKLEAVRPKPSKVTLGGKVRHLLFDLNSMAEIEDVYDSVEHAFELVDEGKVKPIRFMVHATLAAKPEGSADYTTFFDGKPSEQDVGSWIGMGNIGDVGAALMDAFMSQVPEEVRKKIEDAQKMAESVKDAGIELPQGADQGNAEGPA